MQVENVLKNAAQIYVIYAEFKTSVEKFSKTLWAELDIQKIVSATDEFLVRLRKMRNLKSDPTYINLEAKIKAFQDSLPLIQVILTL